MSESEPKPKDLKAGRILTHRYYDAPRDMVPVATWLDIWQRNPVEAVGNIFDMGHKMGTGGQELSQLLNPEDPAIPIEQFEEATLEWLGQGPHSWGQYEKLFRALELRDGFMCPRILEWFKSNLGKLRLISGPPHYGWSNLLEQLEQLNEGKSFKEVRDEWMRKSREARKQFSEEDPSALK